ncbi:SCP-like protein [Ancylostoma duodenale]|uniref:SCP-like protein n=1 Tax=Ancylostoma duodenale TaxID=51022 RepID=A0A0C2GIS4_9BILA|nr:SCP-like protein [Ancylostoma duodenale]
MSLSVLLELVLLGAGIHAESRCPDDSGMDDFTRGVVLDYHDNTRRSVAVGVLSNKTGFLGPARDMFKLEWDCDLEGEAKQIASNCPKEVPGNSAQNIGTFPGIGSDTNWINAVSAIVPWIFGVQWYGVTNSENKLTNPRLSNFANMVHSRSTKVGCGYKQCGELFTLICVYNKIGNKLGTVMWESGPACKSNADCSTYGGSTCRNKLCVAPSGKNGKTSTPTENLQHKIEKEGQTEDTNTKEENNPTDQKFEMCSKNKNLNDKARKNLVNTHNKFRSTLGKGLAKDPLGTNGIAPKAARMLKMIYDCEIEYNAQKHADSCVFKHSPSSQRPGLGENLWMTSAKNYGVDLAAVSASESWWSELKQNGVGPSNILTDALWNRPHKMIGHYTQMAWQNSYKLGCGIKWCPSMTYVVCQYGPAGNWMGSLIYDIGNPCTTDADCKCKGCKCSQEEALCIMPDTSTPTTNDKNSNADKEEQNRPNQENNENKKPSTDNNTKPKDDAGSHEKPAEPKDEAGSHEKPSEKNNTEKDQSTVPASCPSSQITEKQRQLFLDLHNNVRLNIALGKQPNKVRFLGPAQNMYKMEWDCQYEKDAQSMANVCGMSTWLGPASNRIAWSAGSNIAPSAVDGYIRNTFNYWIQAAKQQGAGNVYNNSALYSFANVAFSKITKIGCGYKACGGNLYINCVYSVNGAYTGTVLWENGSACQKDQDCTLYEDSKCEDRLCIAPKDAKLAVGGSDKMCPKNKNLNDKARQNLVDTHNKLRCVSRVS